MRFWKALTIPGILLLVASLFSCGENKTNTIEWSARTDSILRDTGAIHYYADSLRTQALNSTSDTGQIMSVSQMAEFLPYGNMSHLADDVLALSEKRNFTRGIIDATCKKGISLFKQQLYDSAFQYFSDSRNMARKHGDKNLEAQALCWMGDYYRLTYQFELCLSTLDTAYQIALEAKNYPRQAHAMAFTGDIYRVQGIYDTCLYYYDIALKAAQQGNDMLRESFIYTNLGEYYRLTGKFDSASLVLDKALDVAERMNDHARLGFILSNKGDVERLQGRMSEALKYYNDAIYHATIANDKRRITFCYSCIADTYLGTGELDKADSIARLGLDIAKNINDRNSQSSLLSILGEVSRKNGHYDEAAIYFDEATQISRDANNRLRLAVNLLSLADLRVQQSRFEEARQLAEEGLEVATAVDDPNEIGDAHRILGDYYYKTGNIPRAIEESNKALKVAADNNILWIVSNSAENLARLYRIQNDFRNADTSYRLFIRTRDSISGNEQIRRMAAVEYQAKEAEMEAAQAKKEAGLEADKARQQQQITRQRAIIWGTTGGGLLMCVLLFVAVRAYRSKKRSALIIAEQKEEVEKQKNLVEVKNKEVMDSIAYAHRLQHAILTPEDVISTSFQDIFILYLPKDVVAGDFYWYAKTETITFIAACDCTGHGVPGAMVSVVCSNALNRAVKEFGAADPASILEKARELILETFEKSADTVRDGMDISLMALPQSQSNKITWAGANRSLYIARQGNLLTFKGNKQPVGYTEYSGAFTNHIAEAEAGDMIYLLTDGFADQFGGPNGKKFKSSSLEKMFTEIASLPCPAQRGKLLVQFEEWKGDFEQLDDVLIIGIRL